MKLVFVAVLFLFGHGLSMAPTSASLRVDIGSSMLRNANIIPVADDDTQYKIAQSAEIVFWQSVKDSNDPDQFRAYLESYPDGVFSKLARLKIRKIGGAGSNTSTSEVNQTSAVTKSSSNLLTPDNNQWIQIASRQDLDEAIQFAKQYSGSIKLISVLSTTSGWYVVAIGPMPKAKIFDEIKSLAESGEIPVDSIRTGGTTYTSIEWQSNSGMANTSAKSHEIADSSTKPAGNNRDDINKCDRMAAYEHDQYRVADAVPFADMKGHADEAINTCLAASRLKPNSPRLRFQLGRSYLAVDKNSLGLKTYRSLAEENYPAAMLVLGIYYENGRRGLSKDLKKAISLYESAYKAGNLAAGINLAAIYFNNDGNSDDYENPPRALNLYLNLEKTNQDILGMKVMYERLGHLYILGRGIEHDGSKSRHYLNLAVKKKSSWALFLLGRSYQEGYSVTVNLSRAANYFEKAADAGYYSALNNLIEIQLSKLNKQVDYFNENLPFRAAYSSTKAERVRYIKSENIRRFTESIALAERIIEQAKRMVVYGKKAVSRKVSTKRTRSIIAHGKKIKSSVKNALVNFKLSLTDLRYIKSEMEDSCVRISIKATKKGAWVDVFNRCNYKIAVYRLSKPDFFRNDAVTVLGYFHVPAKEKFGVGYKAIKSDRVRFCVFPRKLLLHAYKLKYQDELGKPYYYCGTE